MDGLGYQPGSDPVVTNPADRLATITQGPWPSGDHGAGVITLASGQSFVLKARMAGTGYVEHLFNRYAVRIRK